MFKLEGNRGEILVMLHSVTQLSPPRMRTDHPEQTNTKHCGISLLNLTEVDI